MIWLLLMLLFFAGVFLSAFFSGTETGFYRVTRVRLALDALDGDVSARIMLWLTNNPALFVATTLIGNNLANYLASLATVLGAGRLFPGSYTAELISPIVLAPVVFIYGELLPKSLYYAAPNRLLRRGGPLFFACAIVFAPVSAILWFLDRCLQWVVGESPEKVRLRLAREELEGVMDEGQQAGILRPIQRRMVQGMFAVAKEPVVRFSIPTARMTSVRKEVQRAELLRLARRQRSPFVLVTEKRNRQPIGYVRIVDLHLRDGDWVEAIRPLMTVHQRDTNINTLFRMQTAKEAVAQIIDDQERTVGMVTIDRLREPLLSGK
jgi:CBS domain containing-hemolysin-like protein